MAGWSGPTGAAMNLRRAFFLLVFSTVSSGLLVSSALSDPIPQDILSGARQTAALTLPESKVMAQVVLPVRYQAGREALTLTGCGVRPFLWMDLYVAALYLPEAGGQAAMGSPARGKVIRMTILDGSILPLHIPAHFRRALSGYLPEAKLDELDRRFRDLRREDTLLLAYTPGDGLRLSINQVEVASIPGHDGVMALLSAWGGEKPWQPKLEEMLRRFPC
jgi:hypothetical protein